jgi:hypothetical protein
MVGKDQFAWGAKGKLLEGFRHAHTPSMLKAVSQVHTPEVYQILGELTSSLFNYTQAATQQILLPACSRLGLFVFAGTCLCHFPRSGIVKF